MNPYKKAEFHAVLPYDTLGLSTEDAEDLKQEVYKQLHLEICQLDFVQEYVSERIEQYGYRVTENMLRNLEAEMHQRINRGEVTNLNAVSSTVIACTEILKDVLKQSSL